MLILVMVFTMMPGQFFTETVEAATSKQLDYSAYNDKVTMAYDSGTWIVTNGTVSGEVTGTSGGGCGPDEAGESTLTISHSYNSAAVLSFDYDATLNGGSVKIGEDTVTGARNFKMTIEPGERVPIKLKTKAGEHTTKIVLSNIRLYIADENRPSRSNQQSTEAIRWMET